MFPLRCVSSSWSCKSQIGGRGVKRGGFLTPVVPCLILSSHLIFFWTLKCTLCRAVCLLGLYLKSTSGLPGLGFLICQPPSHSCKMVLFFFLLMSPGEMVASSSTLGYHAVCLCGLLENVLVAMSLVPKCSIPRHASVLPKM